MAATELYRVVGVRPDNSRALVCDGATESQSVHAREFLLGSHAFIAVEIERDDREAIGEPATDSPAPAGGSAGSQKPTLGVRSCPVCRCPYVPTAARYMYDARGDSVESRATESRLRSIEYFGECPGGHGVREIVEA